MNEETISKETLIEGLIFNLERHVVSLPNGATSKRDVIRHPGAIGVVAQTPSGDFLMVRQYRKAIEQITVEVVAGTLDPGEESLVTAHRELREETGRIAKTMVPIGTIHPSPGYIEERIDLFFAELSDEIDETSMDDDEFVEAFECSADEVRRMLLDGEITDSKTVSAWWFYENRIARG